MTFLSQSMSQSNIVSSQLTQLTTQSCQVLFLSEFFILFFCYFGIAIFGIAKNGIVVWLFGKKYLEKNGIAPSHYMIKLILFAMKPQTYFLFLYDQIDIIDMKSQTYFLFLWNYLLWNLQLFILYWYYIILYIILYTFHIFCNTIFCCIFVFSSRRKNFPKVLIP